MKAFRNLCLTWAAGLLGGMSAANAVETFRLEPNVYLFRDTPAQSTDRGEGTPAIFQAPTVLQLAGEQLTLRGAEVEWSGGRHPPEGVTVISMPSVLTPAGQPVQLLSAAPVQYFERIEGERFAIKTIGKDSAEAPHCRITLQVEPSGTRERSIQVSCTVSLATVAARQKIEGVDLEVGRPVLARFDQRVELPVRLGEWTALLVPRPNRSPFSLLLLLKATSGTGGAEQLGEVSPQEMASFITFYYRSPAPNRIAAALEALRTSGIWGKATVGSWGSQQSAFTCLGFFSEVFARHPERSQEWREAVDRGPGGDFRYWLRRAVKSETRKSPLEAPSGASLRQEVHFYWGGFTASGNAAYLRRMIERLELLDSSDQESYEAGAQAMLLLANNAPAHPLIAETLREARPEVNPRMRELIDDLLTKDFAAVRQQIEAMRKRDWWFQDGRVWPSPSR